MVRPLGFAIAVLAISLPAFNSPAAQHSERGLRAVDFRNFTYHPLHTGETSIVLRDGLAIIDEHVQAKLVSVAYVDFNSDGTEEAAVVLRTGRVGSALYAEDYYVFEYYQARPRQIFHEWREQPQGMILDRQSLTIIAPYWRERDERCCPSAVEAATYRWQGAGLVLAARRLRTRAPLALQP